MWEINLHRKPSEGPRGNTQRVMKYAIFVRNQSTQKEINSCSNLQTVGASASVVRHTSPQDATLEPTWENTLGLDLIAPDVGNQSPEETIQDPRENTQIYESVHLCQKPIILIREGFIKKINYFDGKFHEGEGVPSPPPRTII